MIGIDPDYRCKSNGYIQLWFLNWNNSGTDRIIPEHRYVMMVYLGRELDIDEVVHHIDENPMNNELDNLQLMSREAHTILHQTGRKRTEETCNKISNALKNGAAPWLGKKMPPELRAKLSECQKDTNNSMYAKRHSEETKAKLREQKLINNPLKGKPLSEEHRSKISESQKGRTSTTKGTHLSEEHKEKIRSALKGRSFTEEHKKNLRKPKGKKP